MKIDLNSDLGESFGRYQLGTDEKIMPLISSSNIACGFHASDPLTMEKTVSLAKKAGIAIGAHPGYPDLVGFGRRNMAVSPEEVKALMLYQIGALQAFCREYDVKLQHVKPHGALYNMAAKDEKLARAVAEAVAAAGDGLILMGLAGSRMIQEAEKIGVPVAQEVFADRGYQEDGSLVPRTQPGALLTDEEEVIARVLRMVQEHKVRSVTGRDIDICADSVCVHGDGEKALIFVEKLRKSFVEANITIAPLWENRE